VSPKKDLVRYKEVRRADALDDQKTAAQILNADALSVTQEALQEFVLSQIKRIIFGNDPGLWKSDFDAAGVRSLSDATSGATSARLLLSYIDEGPAEGFVGGFKEIVGSPWPSQVTWYTDATKTMKIVEKTITRNAEQAPTAITWVFYAVDGTTVAATASDAIVNTGTPAVFEATRTRVIA
jgi:hypothetical protein